jgi:vancomycin resistance protein YoaR
MEDDKKPKKLNKKPATKKIKAAPAKFEHKPSTKTKEAIENAEEVIKISNKVAKRRYFCYVILPIILIAIVIVVCSTVFALANKGNTNMINGIYIKGIDVSGLSKEDAKNKVSEIVNKHLEQKITIKHDEYQTDINAQDFNCSFDIDEAVETAYELGRTGNIFDDNLKIVTGLVSRIDVNPGVKYDKALMDSEFTNINTNLPDLVLDPSYYIDGDSLHIVSGRDGVIIDIEELENILLFELNNMNEKIDTIEIPVFHMNAKQINVDQIYSKVHKEAKNAEFVTEPEYKIISAENGLDFAISIEDARAMVLTPQEEYIIPLQVIYPEVSNNMLPDEAFPDTLGDYSTYYGYSAYNRATNINLATASINGKVLMPGEEFSFNYTVGQRTPDKGYKPAPAYLNGKTIQDYGGGVCQVSSTLYNAVLEANLEVTDRSPHGYVPAYVPYGLDATVSWGAPDFCFVNNRNYAIKIISWTDGSDVHFVIKGLKQDDDVIIKTWTDYISTVYPSTETRYSSSLGSGQSRVVSSGSNGCIVDSYRTVYDQNGNELYTERIARDRYNPHNRVVERGY